MWRSFHSSGTLSLILLFLFVVACTKVKKEFYDDGQVKSEVSYRNDMKNGAAVWYYANGNKQLECSYVNDLMEGPVTRWFHTGALMREDQYSSNQRNGASMVYDESGKIVAIEHYANDTLHGTYVEYYTNGELNIHGRFEMGRWDSIWDYYDIRGLQVGKGEFKNGSGTLTGYYWNGKVKRVIHYKNNKKHGPEIWYAENGKVTKEIQFEEGLVESVIIGDTSSISSSVLQ